jgi:hypothetical protein
MPSNQTPNYALSQWERDDRILMEDFNADNAKIDAALAAQAGTLAAHTAELTRKGNCQISTYTYTGNGRLGEANPTRISFPKGTFLLIIMTQLGTFQHILPGTKNVDWVETYSGHYPSPITWSETSLSIYSDRNAAYQFNSLDTKYTVLSFRKADEI